MTNQIQLYVIEGNDVKLFDNNFQRNQEFSLGKGQISVDLGSSQYAMAYKVDQSETAVINFTGNQVNIKSPGFGTDIVFGNPASKSPSDAALILDWKNCLFDCQEKTHYPNSPVVQSSNHTVQIPVSSIFESFILQSVDTKLTSILSKNKQLKEFVVTVLVPSVSNVEHNQFLYSCFKAVLKQVLINEQIKDLEGYKFYFQLKNEVVVGVVDVLQKKPELQGKNFMFVDVGGYTTTINQVIYANDKYQIKQKFLNIAGNSVDAIRKQLICTQLADVPITNQLMFHETMRNFKETITNNEIKISNQYSSFDKAELFEFVLQTILYGIQKIQQLLIYCATDNLNGLVQYINPFINDNLNNNFFLNEYTSQEQIEELKNKQFETNGQTLQFSELMNRTDTIQTWIWENLKDQLNVLRAFVENQQSYSKYYMFTEAVQQLKWQLKHIVKQQCNDVVELQYCDIQVCQDVLQNIPTFQSYKQFFNYCDHKKQNANLDVQESYQMIHNYLYNSMYFDVKQQLLMKILNDNQYNQKVIEFCQNSDITNISRQKFAEYAGIKIEDAKINDYEQNTLLNQIQDIETQKKICFDMQNNQVLISNIFSITSSNLFEQHANVCEMCGITKYTSFEKTLLEGMNNNVELKKKTINNLFNFHECRFAEQLISNLAIQAMQIFPIQSIQMTEYPTIIFKQDLIRRTEQIVTNEITEQVVDLCKLNNIRDIVFTGGFSAHNDFAEFQNNKEFRVQIVNQTDLDLSGIEGINPILNQIEIQNVEIKQQLEIVLEEEFYINKHEQYKFKSNRACFELGQSGCQGNCAWANSSFAIYNNGNPQLFDDWVKNRTGSICSFKMPSFAILNKTKLINISKLFGNKYLQENGQVNENFYNILYEQKLTTQQLQQAISFESIAANEYIKKETSQKEVQLRQDKLKKKLKTKQENDQNKKQCDLDFIYNWIRKLFEDENPVFPNYPVIQSEFESQQKQIVNVPVSQILISLFLFMRQKYLMMHNDRSKLQHQSELTITVPCNAKQQHLNFIRSCCQSAGWGDNVSFVYEPVSAFAHIYYIKTIYSHYYQDQNVLKEGQYLVINVGSVQTKLSILDAKIINNEPQVSVKYHLSIPKGGNYVDQEFSQFIKFENFISMKNISQKGLFWLKNFMNGMKGGSCNNELEYILFEIQLQDFVDRQKIHDTQFIKNVQIQDNKLFFKVQKYIMSQAIQNVSEQIIENVIEFALQVGIDINQTYVMCVGGMGGSKIFQGVAKQKLYASPYTADKYFINIEPSIAQTAISMGGVYLPEGKDHMNFDIAQVRLYGEELKTMNILDNITMKYVRQNGILAQCGEQSQHICDINELKFVCEEQEVQCDILCQKENTFLYRNLMNVNRFFCVQCGMFGVPVSFLVKSFQKELKIAMLFSIADLNNMDCEYESKSDNKLNQIYFGLFSVQRMTVHGQVNEECTQMVPKQFEDVVKVICILSKKNFDLYCPERSRREYNDLCKTVYINVLWMEQVPEEKVKELERMEEK